MHHLSHRKSSEKTGKDQHGESEESEELEDNGFSFVSWVVVILAIFLCGREIAYSMLSPKSSSVEGLASVIKDIEKEFPNQKDELWKSIFTVLSQVSESDTTCPKVILLLDQGDETSSKTSKCLVEKVANQSAHHLPFRQKEPLFLNGGDLSCPDCMEKQRLKVMEYGTIVIHHLENFPLESAETLHFFCDEHESEFAKAAYLLTMSVNSRETNPTTAAERALRSSWASMRVNKLEPLISRLTSLVHFVQLEKSLNCHL